MKKTASNPINYIAGALWAYFVIEEVIGLIRFPGGLNMGVIVEIIGMILIAAAVIPAPGAMGPDPERLVVHTCHNVCHKHAHFADHHSYQLRI